MQRLSIENSIIKVKSLSRIGEFDQGINILRSILIKYPKNLRIQKELENLIAKSSDNNCKNISETQLNNLFNLFKRGLLNEVLIEAEEILEKFPSEFLVWNLLGIAKAKKGDFLDASYSFEKAVKLNPSFIDGYNNLGNLLLEQEPSEDNKIVLNQNKKDKYGIPKVKLFYKRSPKPLRTAKVFLEEFANFCIENDLGRIAIEENIFNLEYLKLVGDGGHHMGGTRMGNDKKNSVVNSDLRVHDVNNLYVNGSSNFVTGGYTNPTFSIVQLAIRLANTISNLIKKT